MELTLPLVLGGLAIAYMASRTLRASHRRQLDQLEAGEPQPGHPIDWRAVALRHGLTLFTMTDQVHRHPDDVKMLGQIHGFPIELAIEHDNAHAYRCWGRVRFRPRLGMGLDIDQNSRFLDRDAFRTGDATFDAAFIIRGKDRDGAVRYLTSEIRLAMLELARGADWVTMTDDGLWWTRLRPSAWSARGPRADRVERDLSLMIQFALALRNARHTHAGHEADAPQGDG